jgi:DeoR/GlpR family transcriptional regulator of sugar metabolism
LKLTSSFHKVNIKKIKEKQIIKNIKSTYDQEVKRVLAITRREEIAQLVEQQHAVIVTELSQRYRVTEETIRKDLEKLEFEGRLKRTHGGAIKMTARNNDKEDIGSEISFETRNSTLMPEKRQIAKKAAQFVHDHEVIALDASTTSLQLAFELRNKHNLTVVTNSLHVVNVLKDCADIHVFCSGGSLQQKSHCFVGESTENMLQQYAIQKFFLSTRGLTLERGLLEPNEQEARVKKVLIELAQEVFLLQDHSKFGQSAFYPICPLHQIDTIITDNATSGMFLQHIRTLGVTVLETEAKEG